MKVRILISILIFCGLAATIFIFARSAFLSDILSSIAPSPTPSATTTPIEPDMSKTNRNKTTPQPSGPVTGQASNAAESLPVSDMPPAAANQHVPEPVEINKINRVPIRTANTDAPPSADGALSHPPAQKKRSSRQKKPL